MELAFKAEHSKVMTVVCNACHSMTHIIGLWVSTAK